MTITSPLPSTAGPPGPPAQARPCVLDGDAAAAQRLPAASRSVTAAVVGAAGFTGALLAELLLRHPGVALVQLSSERLAGAPVAKHLPRLKTGLAFTSPAEVGGVDVAFVCAPHGQAAHAVRRLLDGGARVIDLSADFRLDVETYAAWYQPHPYPELVPEAVYGLTELHRDELAGAALVANPGCYPTAALLALAPLAPLGLLDVVIDAKSGVSGAGKTPRAGTHFCSVADDVVAYAVGGHRHYPEIVAGLAGCATGPAPAVTFVPHLVPVQRGIVETIYVRAARLPTAAALRALYDEAYAGEQFVAVADAPPELKDVVGTNDCRIFATLDERAARIVVICAIDNLMKGASGQAVQNLNVMAGFPQGWGLT